MRKTTFNNFDLGISEANSQVIDETIFLIDEIRLLCDEFDEQQQKEKFESIKMFLFKLSKRVDELNK